MSRKIFVAFWVALALVCIVGLIIWLPVVWSTSPDLERIQEITGFRFPPGSKLIGSTMNQGTLTAGIEIPGKDARSFAHSLPNARIINSNQLPGEPTPMICPEWNPTEQFGESVCIGGDSLNPAGDYRVLVGLAKKQRVDVHLVWRTR